MLFQVKHQPEDFIVEELLPQLPAGQGDIFYVYIEKRNLTTMEVVEFLQRSFHLSREDIGIAGLKDKVGITRQWISLFKRKLEQIGGESAFLAVLNEQVNVLQTSRGTQPLRVGGNAGNKFTVRLRATSTVSEPVKMLIEKNIENVQTKGFPNCF
ncbi:MAG: tRNA pseudouridine(13) synthase TruD [Candidatus Peribacteria bacterium]|jgi:tRNA pseudouridine13 synthase|nr:tRNA pseudouridine(13) synthase TruD [Candidatus Peribacteria bacterium]